MCGTRTWNDWGAVYRELVALDNPRVIEGGARGADWIAMRLSKALDCHERTFPADWSRYGSAAGPIRNKQMLVEGKPDLVIAFWNGDSWGTANMIRQAKAAKIEITIVGTLGAFV